MLVMTLFLWQAVSGMQILNKIWTSHRLKTKRAGAAGTPARHGRGSLPAPSRSNGGDLANDLPQEVIATGLHQGLGSTPIKAGKRIATDRSSSHCTRVCCSWGRAQGWPGNQRCSPHRGAGMAQRFDAVHPLLLGQEHQIDLGLHLKPKLPNLPSWSR